jgi:3-hydroxyisobutyrate dehydrogenase-like beta-hydroxyacid dehydrogenase
MTKPTIGFIGLGLMGAAMVERLQAVGYSVVITANRSRPRIDAAVARGAVEVATARDVAAASDVVMFCMDTSASVEARVYGPDGVLEGLRSGAIVVDFGTSLPASTKKIGADIVAKGGAYLDAPLGRTPAHAVDGKLNIMGAGDKAAFDKVEPVLKDLGENVFHLGPLGTGHTIKLINNFFGMTTACAMSEAFAMADVAGIDRQALYSVMSAGPLRSGMMDMVRAYAVEGRQDLEFSIANASKDVGYYGQMTKDLGLTSRMSGCATNALAEAVADGKGDEMVSAMVDVLSGKFAAKA